MVGGRVGCLALFEPGAGHGKEKKKDQNNESYIFPPKPVYMEKQIDRRMMMYNNSYLFFLLLEYPIVHSAPGNQTGKPHLPSMETSVLSFIFSCIIKNEER